MKLRRARISVVFLAAVALGAVCALLKPPEVKPAAPVAHAPVNVEPLAPEMVKPAKPRKLFKPVRGAAIQRPYPDQSVRTSPPPSFTEIADGRYEATGPIYRAELTAGDGLVYFPTETRREEAAPGVQTQLKVRLRSVARGENTIFTRENNPDADTEIAVDDNDGGLSFWRADDFEENYKPRGDGVEQSFYLNSEPEGDGDMSIACDLSVSGLKPLPQRKDRNGGIFFADARGRIAARYGQVVVRDSGGEGIVIEPSLSADGQSISFAVPHKFLSTATYPVHVDPLVGNNFFVTADIPTTVGPPTMAASNTNFLVVWNDFRAGLNAPQLFGSIVSPSGTPLPEFVVSLNTGIPREFRFQRIGVASDGTNWLVAWGDTRVGGVGVRGVVVTPNIALPTGAEVSGGADFLIAATTGGVIEDPLVAYNGTEFVVAWQTQPASGGTSLVQYTRVTSTRVVGAAQSVPNASATVNQVLLFLAPQKPSGETLLVYRENSESPAATRSIRIAPDGTIKDPGGTVLFKENAVDGGFGRPIGAAFVANEWQILSSFDQMQDSSVFLHKLSTAGAVTPPAGVFAEVGLGPTGAVADQYAPAFAGANEWLFLRNQKVGAVLFHLLGKRVTFAGVDRDPIPFQIDTATQGIIRNGIAAQIGNNFLVTWLDGRTGGAQPGDARDVAGAIVDSTFAGAVGTALTAVASASPASGEAPLNVMFSSAGSKGDFDSLIWDFGDGTTSDQANPAHEYRTNGIFNAVLKLTKGAYSVFDRVVIRVGAGTTTTGGTRIGTPVANSPGVETSIFVSTAVVRLNFAAPVMDAIRVVGLVDQGLLPETLTGLNAVVTVGKSSFTFSLDAKGQSKSETANFSVNPQTGAFAFQVTAQDLVAAMAPLGLINEDIRPPKIIEMPISLTIDTFSASYKVGLAYRATRNDNGVGSYQFLEAGDEVSGAFVITSFGASETVQGKTGVKVHTFSVKGQIVRPNGGLFKPALAGEFRIAIGNFFVAVPVGQFRVDGGKLKFVARVGISGLKKFSMDLNSGVFNLQMLKVPAEGGGASGLFVAKSGDNITKVDLNLSLTLDLENEKFSAGRYIFISRKDIKTKNWKLR